MSLPQPGDWEENGGEASSCCSQQLKRPRCSCCCNDKQMQLLEEMRHMLHKQNEKLESMYRENQDLREKVFCFTAEINAHIRMATEEGLDQKFKDRSRLDGYLQQSPVPRLLYDQSCRIPLHLKFLNACKNDKYSTRKIEADDGTPLKVAIFDHNNKIITCGPISSMRVQIVPVHGDFDNDHRGQWTEEYFSSKIVPGRSGKEPLLSGDLYIRLQDGVGYLNSAKFQDNSSFVACKRFKLGVMAADETISERIQEGITESFAVKDIRGYSTKKNLNPSPRDAVYKLSRIAMNGDRHKLLEKNSIKTVEDFLCFYKKSPEDLRKILGKISDQEWDTIIKHAHKCNPGIGIYSSCIQERNVSHENEKFSRSDGTCYLQGSCSVQPRPIQQKQLNIQVTHQQISSTYNGQSSFASLEDVPGEHKGIRVAGQQLPQIGNEVLSVSSMDNNALKGYTLQQGRSTECNITLDGNLLPCMENSELDHKLACLRAFLLDEKDTSREYVLTQDSCGGCSCNAFDQTSLHSSASEAGSISCRGTSPVSEAGSWSHTELSPLPSARGAGRRLPFSRARGARRRRCKGLSHSPFSGAGSSVPQAWIPPTLWEANSVSNTSKDLTTDDEE